MQQQDVAHTEKAFVAGEKGKENRVKVFGLSSRMVMIRKNQMHLCLTQLF